MNEVLFRFTLSNAILGDLEIDEPDGWKDATLKLERDKEFHSLVEFYDQSFTFYGNPRIRYDAGYEYIMTVLETQGPDADIGILVELSESSGDDWETLFDGLLDLSGIKEIDFYKVEVGAVRNDLWSRFINQRGTAIDIKKATDIYGESRVILESDEITLTNQPINKSFKGYYSSIDPNPFFQSDGWSPSQYLQQDVDVVTLNEILETFTFADAINPSVPVPKFTLDKGGIYKFDFRIEAWAATFTPNVQVPGNAYVKWYIQINADTPISFTETNFGTAPYQSTVYSYVATKNLNVNDDIRIYGDIIADLTPLGTNPFYLILGFSTNDTPSHSGHDFGTHPTYFNIIAETTFPDTQCEGIFIHEALQSILDRIIGKDDTLYSEYLGNIDTQRVDYVLNGCFSYSSLQKGLHIKGFSFADKPLAMSFNDIWSGLNPMFSLGLGYENLASSPEKEIIRIEPKSYFYDNNPVLFLDFVNKIEHSITTDSIFKNIKIGYEKWESENVSGLDEVQTKHEYAVPLKKIGEEITLYSKFIVAALAIENTRRLSTERSKDWRLDNDIFIIHLTPGSPLLPYTAENLGILSPPLPTGTNINDPELRYNLLFTPARNFQRWQKYFNGGLQFNDTYLYQNGEGNTDAIIDDGGGDCGIGSVAENDNFAISADYLFGIDVYEFEHPLTWTQYKLIRNNRKKAIGVSTTDADHESFFILSLEWSPVTPKGKFKVIKASSGFIPEGCWTFDSTVDSFDSTLLTFDCE